ncbi:MAG TPA: arginine deiminase family protein [Pyrinomonadaceae bacterium]|nr:arginine deiminase family protein [Pyrinomonadaceae bacterium]
MFSKAIVKEPCANFAAGLTNADLGNPDPKIVLRQHQAYCEALESCGLELIRLPRVDEYPDSTFVEDTALLTGRGAVLTRPGADSRRGEVESIAPVVRRSFRHVHSIEEPGTLDAGDVCEAGEHFFIGISRRTNEHGARQLAGFLNSFGYSSSLIDIRGLSNILHLKSGLAYLSGKRLVVTEALRSVPEFSGYDLICLNATEEYAANCLSLNGSILLASGFRSVRRELELLGYPMISLEMSEFQKMDGGLSCLSLRF